MVRALDNLTKVGGGYQAPVITNKLIRRPSLDKLAHATVFSTPDCHAYLQDGAPLAPADLAKVLLGECVVSGSKRPAATLYFDVLSADMEKMMLQQGITVINPIRMQNPEREALLRFAREHNLALDYHAPWLSKEEPQGSCYPDPKNSSPVFFSLLNLVWKHRVIFGAKPQVTIHVTDSSRTWGRWLEAMRKDADVIIENAFKAPVERENIRNAYAYFQASSFHTPEDVMEFARDLRIIRLCFDQAHAFGGWVNEDGTFDPLGDLRFLDQLLEEGFQIARFHRAAFPRRMKRRDGCALDQIDTHGDLEPFSRISFLANFRTEEERALINRVFDRLSEMGEIKVTFEVKPAHYAASDFTTDFS